MIAKKKLKNDLTNKLFWLFWEPFKVIPIADIAPKRDINYLVVENFFGDRDRAKALTYMSLF